MDTVKEISEYWCDEKGYTTLFLALTRLDYKTIFYQPNRSKTILVKRAKGIKTYKRKKNE